MKKFDVTAMGELLVDFTENGISDRGNVLLEANPGGAPCNVLSMLQRLGKRTAFIGKVGQDAFGDMLIKAVREQGINTDNLLTDKTAPHHLGFCAYRRRRRPQLFLLQKPGCGYDAQGK